MVSYKNVHGTSLETCFTYGKTVVNVLLRGNTNEKSTQKSDKTVGL